MVDDALLEREGLSDEEWPVTPEPEHLVPDSIAREQASEDFQDQLADDPSAICITHDDADGLTSAALVTAMHGRDTAVRTVSYQGAYRFPHAIEDLQAADPGLTPLYITDFALDDRGTAEVLGGYIDENNAGSRVQWFDHHQWDEGARDAVESAGVDLHIDEDECAASLIEREVDHEFNDHVQDLVDVTKDIDLWIREDERSPRLNVWASVAEPREYVDSVLEHGADHPDPVAERIDERLERNEELEAEAVQRATQHTVGEWTVATTYVRGGRSSEIGNHLVEEHEDNHDIAIVQKPDDHEIYSHSDREGFARCHEIADELGGGGHPTAAGCAVPIETFRGLARYWASAGESVRDDVLDAVRAVARDSSDQKANWDASDVRFETGTADE